ncbi:MAG: restriction endonuclease subunit S [Nitrosomonadales bacterium]|nr:restriction endonuclease subunit S [Nitrosomonadales bacterium]
MTHQARKLGEVCQVLTGGTPSRTKLEYFGGGIPWVKITDMLQGTVISTDESLTAAGIENSSAKLMPPGTVLISIFATIGRTAVLGIEAATNQAIAGVVPKDNAQLDSQYLRYFLDSQHGELNRVARGVAQPNINQGILKDIDVPLPPLAEQRRIVDILSRAEGIVRLRREAEKKAAELIPALFLDMFGDPATNPKGCPSALLGELCDVKGGGTPSKKNPAFWIGEIPWVSPKDMSGVDVIENAEDHISVDAVKNSATNLIPVGSVLIVTRSGVLKHTVPCAITSREVAINQDIKAFVPHKEIAPHFLLSQCQIRAKEILGLVRVGATVQNIETEALKRMRFIYPSMDDQVMFSEKCEQIRSIQSQQSAATAKAQATFDALLAQVFSINGG